MSPEVPIIILMLGVLIYFSSKWTLKKLKLEMFQIENT
jgi:hypothetical protein